MVESPSCSASSFCMGPRVSLYGQRVVQWSPLQIRQDTIFCPFSLFMGSSSWSWAFKSCIRKEKIFCTFRHSGKGDSPSNTATNNEQQCKNYNGSVATAYLFARNEGHEDVVTDCGGGNIGTWCIKLRVAKFLPVLKEKTHTNQVPYFSQSPVQEKCT